MSVKIQKWFIYFRMFIRGCALRKGIRNLTEKWLYFFQEDFFYSVITLNELFLGSQETAMLPVPILTKIYKLCCRYFCQQHAFFADMVNTIFCSC